MGYREGFEGAVRGLGSQLCDILAGLAARMSLSSSASEVRVDGAWTASAAVSPDYSLAAGR